MQRPRFQLILCMEFKGIVWVGNRLQKNNHFHYFVSISFLNSDPWHHQGICWTGVHWIFYLHSLQALESHLHYIFVSNYTELLPHDWRHLYISQRPFECDHKYKSTLKKNCKQTKLSRFPSLCNLKTSFFHLLLMQSYIHHDILQYWNVKMISVFHNESSANTKHIRKTVIGTMFLHVKCFDFSHLSDKIAVFLKAWYYKYQNENYKWITIFCLWLNKII